jgi:hypothetical protein
MAGAILDDQLNLGADRLQLFHELLSDGERTVPVRPAMKNEHGHAFELLEG